MYSKCKAIIEAESAFNALSLQDIVAWNAMLSAYKSHGLEEETLLLYKHMQHEGLAPNQISFMIVLEACGNMAKRNYSYSSIALDIAYGLHSDIRKACYANDDFVNTALMSAYGNCGALMDVEMIFGALHVRSMATWTAMLRAYMDQGEVEKALSFYSQMQENIIVDDIMFLAILQLCSETGCLIYFKQTHYTLVVVGFDKIPFIVSSIITGYGSCASMLDGQATFAGFEEPTLESWNACIAGYSVVGKLSASFHILEELRMAGVRPDEATFVSVFVACSHCGRIRESFEYLWSMEKDYGLTPDVKHYTTSIDLLGRVGQLQKAMQLLKGLPAQADSAAWSSLLGACCMHSDAMLAEIVFEYAARVHADQVDTYVLLSNVYALNKCAENVT
ncbi:hypothetical protein KP509_27G014200 [Ceratopteris richardii]|nr:hypothetical protein KP509_27G014200 [Ceratopteris richardii]